MNNCFFSKLARTSQRTVPWLILTKLRLCRHILIQTPNTKSVGRCAVRQRNHHLFTWRFENCCCVTTTYFSATSRHVADTWLVPGQSVSLLRRVAKYTSCGNAITMTKRTFGKWHRFRNLSHKQAAETVWIPLGSLYSAQLLPLLPHAPVVRSQLNAYVHKCSVFCRARLEGCWKSLYQ
jgi:hypothetical protein